MIQDFIFYIFAVLVLFSALGVVLFRNIMRAAISLMILLLLTAGFYILLKTEFLAGIQVLVYIGGILVLIVFTIMLTGAQAKEKLTSSLFRNLFALIVSLTFFLWSSLALINTPFIESSIVHEKEIEMIGHSLLSVDAHGFLLVFEIMSILLLAVLIGSLVIARKDKPA